MTRVTRRRKRRRFAFLTILVVLVGTYFLGPRISFEAVDPTIQPVAVSLADLEGYITDKEGKVEGLRPDNTSRIIWANDTAPALTEYSVVFLHGFSASPEAGDPVVPDFAKRYGMNVYMPRLAGHGFVTKESFAELTPAALVNTAKDALAIGKVMGKKTIVFGSSTGCTLAMYLAAHNPEYVHSLFLYSPNVELADPNAKLLTGPWGEQLARQLIGDYRKIPEPYKEGYAQYWTTEYRVEGLFALQALLDMTMTEETFSKITQPTFMCYYRQDEEHKDDVISIPAARAALAQFGTPEGQTWTVSLSDVGCHPMLNRFLPTTTVTLEKQTYAFAEEVLGLEAPVPVFEEPPLEIGIIAD